MSELKAGLFACEYTLVNSYFYCYICYHINAINMHKQ